MNVMISRIGMNEKNIWLQKILRHHDLEIGDIFTDDVQQFRVFARDIGHEPGPSLKVPLSLFSVLSISSRVWILPVSLLVRRVVVEFAARQFPGSAYRGRRIVLAHEDQKDEQQDPPNSQLPLLG